MMVERRAEAVQEEDAAEPRAGRTRRDGSSGNTGDRNQSPFDLGREDLREHRSRAACHATRAGEAEAEAEDATLEIAAELVVGRSPAPLSEGGRLLPVTVTPRQDSFERQIFIERRPVQPKGRDLDPAHFFLGGRPQPRVALGGKTHLVAAGEPDEDHSSLMPCFQGAVSQGARPIFVCLLSRICGLIRARVGSPSHEATRIRCLLAFGSHTHFWWSVSPCR